MMRWPDDRTGRITKIALLAAMSLAVQWMESLLPPPVPGVPVRLGLANIFVLYALLELSPGEALLISVLRSVLFPLVSGNVAGMAFSLCGGILSWLIMRVLLPVLRKERISAVGLSVAGAGAFQAGQALPGYFAAGEAMLAYLPLMILLSVPAGIATGWICEVLIRRVGKKGKRENENGR